MTQPSRIESIIDSDCRALKAARREQAKARRSQNQNIRRLGRAIASAIVARGSFEQSDLAHAGYSADEGKALYEPALKHARRIEPRLDELVAPC